MKVRREVTVKTDEFKLGDTIRFTLKNNEKVCAFAVRDLGDNMVFLFRNCLEREYPMNEVDDNEGGYKKSYLRSELNTNIIKLFPKKIRKKMVPFKNGDFLSIPSEKDIFGHNGKNKNRFYGMDRQQNRIVDDYRWYWLKDVAEEGSIEFTQVTSNGYSIYEYASILSGVRPVFILRNTGMMHEITD